MTLRVDHPDIDKLVRELVSHTGETVPQAVLAALSERLEREKRGPGRSRAEWLLQIGRECAALPVLDTRTSEEILGYDLHGIPA